MHKVLKSKATKKLSKAPTPLSWPIYKGSIKKKKIKLIKSIIFRLNGIKNSSNNVRNNWKNRALKNGKIFDKFLFKCVKIKAKLNSMSLKLKC
jgi:hypothetical protein